MRPELKEEFQRVARAIRWHLDRHAAWGDGYWKKN
jgi:hypothetical protein